MVRTDNDVSRQVRYVFAVAIPQPLRQSTLQTVEQYCEDRIPSHVRNELRMEASIRGDAIMIVERRPP